MAREKALILGLVVGPITAAVLFALLRVARKGRAAPGAGGSLRVPIAPAANAPAVPAAGPAAAQVIPADEGPTIAQTDFRVAGSDSHAP